jgi:hypothetical protein
MTDISGKHIADAMAQTLETLAFMEVLSAGLDGNLDDADNYYTSTINLNSPYKGTLFITMPEKLLKLVSEVVFDDSGDESDGAESDGGSAALNGDVLNDILNEIANTYAGNLLSQVVPAEQTFSIGFPKTYTGIPNKNSHDWNFFTVDDVPLFAVDVKIAES